MKGNKFMLKKKEEENKIDFEVVIIGSDINPYYMARNFHEAYGIKSHLIGKTAMPFTSLSSIIDIEYEEDIWETKVFKKKLKNYALSRKGKRLILIGTNDFYIRLISENKEFLQQYYLINCVDKDLLDDLLIKDNFYTKFADYGIDMPKSYIYSCANKKEIDKTILTKFKYPIIVKPGNSVTYHKNEFEGQAKVYKLDTEAEVLKVIAQIKKAGYKDNLIIQEYIPGDDSMLFDAVIYSGTDKKVQFMTFAQIGLQEHTPTGIGNCTVLVNGYNEFGETEKIMKKLKKFAEDIGYQGPGEFDLKYDVRDKKFKVLEINPRQGRSSYYPTFCGYNLATYLVDDLIYNKNKEKKFVAVTEKMALSFVPMSVIKKHVVNKKLVAEVVKLKKQGKLVNSIKYSKDMSLARRKWLFLRDINYAKKYKNCKW